MLIRSLIKDDINLPVASIFLLTYAEANNPAANETRRISHPALTRS
jgi:hypothetical protein